MLLATFVSRFYSLSTFHFLISLDYQLAFFYSFKRQGFKLRRELKYKKLFKKNIPNKSVGRSLLMAVSKD